jgi:hypothetical protein
VQEGIHGVNPMGLQDNILVIEGRLGLMLRGISQRSGAKCHSLPFAIAKDASRG